MDNAIELTHQPGDSTRSAAKKSKTTKTEKTTTVKSTAAKKTTGTARVKTPRRAVKTEK
jgi:hypothetical protein